MASKTYDLNILSAEPLIAPAALKSATPMRDAHYKTVLESRAVIQDIIQKKDPRLLGIVGPCSIHDRVAALEYARRLKELSREVGDRIYLIMRVYFEKPRTSLGWRGLITDPHLDGSYDLAHGLRLAREILLEITAMGVAAGSELLDPIVPQYIDDLVSWAAIGARTIESQTHREMASGLSVPVGFKNGTDGGYESAVNALKSCRSSHSFIGIDQSGKTCVLKTAGNPHAHVISRGGNDRPNYSPQDIDHAESLLKAAGIEPAILLDCSHGNSGKKQINQEYVLQAVLEQRLRKRDSIIGFMIESNLFEGNQPIPADLSDLKYGVSITDECVGWDATRDMVIYAHRRLAESGARLGSDRDATGSAPQPG